MSDFKHVVQVISEIDDRAQLEDFLYGITTQTERDELGMRLEIIKQLLDGVPQHKIAKDLGVGVATVSRGSKELSSGRFKVLTDV